jgi:hypothetical protein
VGNVKETIAADSMVTVLTAYQDGKPEDVIRHRNTTLLEHFQDLIYTSYIQR